MNVYINVIRTGEDIPVNCRYIKGKYIMFKSVKGPVDNVMFSARSRY